MATTATISRHAADALSAPSVSISRRRGTRSRSRIQIEALIYAAALIALVQFCLLTVRVDMYGGGDYGGGGADGEEMSAAMPMTIPQPNLPVTSKRIWRLHPRATRWLYHVAGVNLAEFGMAKKIKAKAKKNRKSRPSEPYELFDDYDIGDQVRGDETWKEMLRYKTDLRKPSLAFYVDKVAQKRWRGAVGIPIVDAISLKYINELTEERVPEETIGRDDQREAILRLLPEGANYVAKPSHLSQSAGVFLVRYDESTGESQLGLRGHKIGTEEEFSLDTIADSLADSLAKRAYSGDSWAVKEKVRSGVVVEDRYSAFDTDLEPAMEFKCFMVWGKLFFINWRRGHHRPGLLDSNGEVMELNGKISNRLPDWVDWKKVASLAERFGAHKDMVRVDIIIGVPAGSPSLRDGATHEERVEAARYMLNEIEFKPGTTIKEDPGPELFEEMARIWIAGYKIGNYRVVPNDETPLAFKEKGILTEEDANMLSLL